MADARQAGPCPAPLWDVVEESLDEAEFLWGRWEDVLSSHTRDLAGVTTWVERRLLGAVDGVGAAGAAALEPLLLPALVGECGTRATAAAYTLAVHGDEAGTSALLAASRASQPPERAAARRAIDLSHSEALLARLEREAVTYPELGAVLIRARAFQRRDPGPRLWAALNAPDPELHLAALRALRHPSFQDASAALAQDIAADDPVVRDAAIETGLILGVPAAWNRCLELARVANPDGRAHLLWCAMLGTERDQVIVLDALRTEPTRAEALFALGFAGTVSAIEACLNAMRDPPSAKLAAEAFCAITGLDLESERLVAPSPPEPAEPIPFENEDLDADLVPSPDDLLPAPEVEGVMRWWEKHCGRFAAGQRYLDGRPVELPALQRSLELGPMRRRHAIALELAARTGGRYQVETRAFTADQRRQMRAFERLGGASMPRSSLSRFFSPA